MELWGVDFSSAPNRRKPVVLARGEMRGAVVRLQSLENFASLPAFEEAVRRPGPWVGAFDFPFGVPRIFAQSLALGEDTRSVLQAIRQRCTTRMAMRALVDLWSQGQPAGQKLPHRATDVAMPGISSTSPLQTRYVPVGFMYYEGLARLLAAGVHLPQLSGGDKSRVALEGYPGLLAFELIGRRSYKNSELPDRLMARKDLVETLEQGRTWLGLRLKLTPGQASTLMADASGDQLDAVLCMMQAAWALGRPDFGLPAGVDPVEGWIVTVPQVAGLSVGSPARSSAKPGHRS